MRVPELHTKRLTIREFVLDDLCAVHSLLDTELGGGLDLAARQRWLEWTVLAYVELASLHQPPYGDRAIVLNATGELIGACGYSPLLAPFHQIADMAATSDGFSAEVGLYWAVAPGHQRLGYATEAARKLVAYAFDELHLARILATTAYDNVASIGVMRNLGMQIARNPQPEPEWLQIVGVLSTVP
jgi:RimJ/RimL family protein N-acetyltransferase